MKEEQLDEKLEVPGYQYPPQPLLLNDAHTNYGDSSPSYVSIRTVKGQEISSSLMIIPSSNLPQAHPMYNKTS
ncbi:hypothetical protein HGRIS_005392 [Hohenbuehelia grisea]|uniref:Uncharacterized protein n=1 Tax=Hohenbuehelia grisea TaxID=104357 RepID=A0ABR3JF54_9AGAR